MTTEPSSKANVGCGHDCHRFLRTRGRRRPAFSRTGGGSRPEQRTRRLPQSSTWRLESGDADLVQDVCWDLDKAEKKLNAIRRRLQSVQEQAAYQLQRLATVDTKLTAAIVAALLSGQ